MKNIAQKALFAGAIALASFNVNATNNGPYAEATMFSPVEYETVVGSTLAERKTGATNLVAQGDSTDADTKVRMNDISVLNADLLSALGGTGSAAARVTANSALILDTPSGDQNADLGTVAGLIDGTAGTIQTRVGVVSAKLLNTPAADLDADLSALLARMQAVFTAGFTTDVPANSIPGSTTLEQFVVFLEGL